MSATTVEINGISCVKELDVCFKTYDKTDTQTYYGRIQGTVNFDVAANFGDVIAIHKNMKASVAKREPTSEDYLLIKTKDGAVRPYAICWIDAATFKKVDSGSDATIVIHQINTVDLANVMTAIRGMGFDVDQRT